MGLPAESLLPVGDNAFPPTLAEVPAGERAEEAFGWMPSVGAAAFLGGLALLFSSSGLPKDGGAVVLALGCATFGGLLVAYELKRRRGRTAIVRREGKVGVYRNGQLAASVGVGQVTRLTLRIGNSLQHMMVPAILVGAGGMLIVDPGKAKDTFSIAAVLLGFGAATLGSLVRTRFFLHHYYVPKGKRSEEILLAREDSERLFGKTERTHLL